jgi:hypothetical protein
MFIKFKNGVSPDQAKIIKIQECNRLLNKKKRLTVVFLIVCNIGIAKSIENYNILSFLTRLSKDRQETNIWQLHQTLNSIINC